MFQDPMVIVEDLPLCYPDAYFTHQSPDVSPAPIAATARPKAGLKLRAQLRQSVMAAVRQAPMRGVIGRLGGLLAKNRRLRERAFRDLVIDELLPFKPGAARALEVGCGAGRLLKALAQAGWQVEGFEWDEQAAEIARRTTGQPVMVGDFQNTALPFGAYDLVVLQHVLEHLADTLRCLRKIADILAPGGRAVLIYPNIESLGALMFREDWLHWDPPRHLILPAESAIRKAADDVGLVTVSLKSSARRAEWAIACSRRYRKRELINIHNVSITFQDRLLALYERALMAIGFDLGEELVVVLEKPN
ncbi:MAG TPA: class I SAM-dependent methyltransferase [Blastocatellia bacterium]|nr:class I SAM-dependent methyltransferase [Blastocatellia bacterium]